MAIFNAFNQHKQKSAKSANRTQAVETWQLLVSGIVQGVGFRWSVSQLAQKKGLTGSVCNNSDQTVTITLQASLDDVNQFLKELPENISPYASISTVKKERLEDVAKMHGFHVLY